MKKTITTAEAVEQIAKELNNDKDYYFSWQSNIAVPFIDALNEKGYELPDQHEIANKAAKVFLNRLINTKINLDNRQEIF
jgi:DNA-binding LacI/PurR family transcriptional regulator